VPVLILLFSFGFQRFSSNWEADLAPKTKVAAEAARVFCEGDGVCALTLRVGSRPDGIHLTIDDRLEGNADLSVSHSGGGMGFSVPTGESQRAANVPPGRSSSTATAVATG